MFLERPLASLPADRARQLLAVFRSDLDPADPDATALGFQRVAVDWRDAGGPAAFEPIGVFGYRALDARTGLAYAVDVLDTARGLDLGKTMFLALAHRARVAGHDRLFVITENRALRGALSAFGVVFPAELQLEAYLVGWFDLAASLAWAA